MPKDNHVQNNTSARPPVIVIMGHIDHGKSTLLDYIRKTNIADGEAGGITQRLSAYEVLHKTESGAEKKITFLDTPGHAVFSQMRSRGADVADIAILIVSAKDGVKPQTKEALETIKNAKIPYIVAINKIDKPGANIETTKQNLAENNVLVEGYGGDIPFVPISAKTGKGVDELMDVMLLMAEMEELTGDSDLKASGVVIESHLDTKKGISATLIIKNGTLKSGMCVVVNESMSGVRIFENFLGKPIKEASFSSPVKVVGWSTLPKVGATFESCPTKKDAVKITEENSATLKEKNISTKPDNVSQKSDIEIIPVVIKADVAGMIEVIEKEIKDINLDNVEIKVIHTGAGNVTENDIKLASGSKNPILIGFNIKMNSNMRDLAERMDVSVHIFDIIYKLTEWLEGEIKSRAPKTLTEKITGKAKIIRTFSKNKNKQVIGGKVTEGELKMKANVKIMRRGEKIGTGEIVELQQQKAPTDTVTEGSEFGTMVNSSMEISEGDTIEAFTFIEK